LQNGTSLKTYGATAWPFLLIKSARKWPGSSAIALQGEYDSINPLIYQKINEVCKFLIAIKLRIVEYGQA
jgi:hypothetical protein